MRLDDEGAGLVWLSAASYGMDDMADRRRRLGYGRAAYGSDLAAVLIVELRIERMSAVRS